MCGLVGWQLSPAALQEGSVHTLATILMYMAERRGDDSWGAARYTPGEGINVVKALGASTKTCRIEKLIAPQVLAHTRKATTGAVSLRNAHPFEIGKIVGAHNGFVFAHQEMNNKFKRNFECDSEHVIAHIAENKPLNTLNGVGTVSYLKVNKPGEIFIGRGSSSDMEIYGIGPRNEMRGVVYASVGNWVKDALDMAGFHEYFVFKTYTHRLYKLTTNEVEEVGQFDFGTATGGTDYRNHWSYSGGYESRGIFRDPKGATEPPSNAKKDNDKGIVIIKGNGAYHGSGTSNFDDNKDYVEYWKRRNVANVEEISPSDLDRHVPSSLKKTPEVGGVDGKEKAQETQGKTELCAGCGDRGPRVMRFADNVESGLVHYESVGKLLCFDCAMWWVDETHSPIGSNVIEM